MYGLFFGCTDFSFTDFVRICTDFFQNIAGHPEEATDSDHAACVTGLKTDSHTEFGKRLAIENIFL